jgi:hypothetical protein
MATPMELVMPKTLPKTGSYMFSSTKPLLPPVSNAVWLCEGEVPLCPVAPLVGPCSPSEDKILSNANNTNPTAATLMQPPVKGDIFTPNRSRSNTAAKKGAAANSHKVYAAGTKTREVTNPAMAQLKPSTPVTTHFRGIP